MNEKFYGGGDENYDRKFENSLNGIDPAGLTDEEIEIQERWLMENED